MKTADFSAWFEAQTGFAPHAWQAGLGGEARVDSRLIRVPTGFGKTLGVLAAWSFHRLVRGDESWPRRLVWCLPMRVLVEQTESVARDWLAGLGILLEEGEEPGEGQVDVHRLMGGVPRQEWHLHPEREAVLIGTQDMLLSRALNRGYGAARARWPMEYALLQSDALWVLDEVQLMDVGLVTSVQLQAFREAAPAAPEPGVAPAATWWMSATLQPSWLATVDYAKRLEDLVADQVAIPPAGRRGELFDTQKRLRLQSVPDVSDRSATSWADLVLETHAASRPGPAGRITLAIANTVDGATAIYAALSDRLASLEGAERPSLHLAHSRFRGRERSGWREAFLSRQACVADANRIIVSTQVVEAGVDVSASALVTQLAPWPSLVQRFGRAARYGGEAQVVVVDRELPEGRCAPYEATELEAAARALAQLEDVSPRTLEAFEDELRAGNAELLRELYPYDPLHLIGFRDLRELFDTGPDLTGSDLDVSRFIRSGEERDVQVWWWKFDEGTSPEPELQPRPDALCPVPVSGARKWLFERGRCKQGCRAWVWDYLDGAWRPALERDAYPGQMLLVDASWGGYSAEVGWTGAPAGRRSEPIPTEGTRAETSPALLADLAQHREDLSETPYKTIATHGREAGEEAARLAKSLSLPGHLAALLELAARLHDLGKAHPVFQQAMDRERRDPHVRERNDLAKAPQPVWKRGSAIFGSRRGFRHELASVLALFDAVWQHDPLHPALLGPHRALLEALDIPVPSAATHESVPGAVGELLSLDAESFDLVAYLVCCHHGKVRGSWQSTPHDEGHPGRDDLGPPLRGVGEGDSLPETAVATAGGGVAPFPTVIMHLDPAALGFSERYGASWRERVARLRGRHGDPLLSYLETLLRVADVRASRSLAADPLLEREDPA